MIASLQDACLPASARRGESGLEDGSTGHLARASCHFLRAPRPFAAPSGLFCDPDVLAVGAVFAHNDRFTQNNESVAAEILFEDSSSTMAGTVSIDGQLELPSAPVLPALEGDGSRLREQDPPLTRETCVSAAPAEPGNWPGRPRAPSIQLGYGPQATPPAAMIDLRQSLTPMS